MFDLKRSAYHCCLIEIWKILLFLKPQKPKSFHSNSNKQFHIKSGEMVKTSLQNCNKIALFYFKWVFISPPIKKHTSVFLLKIAVHFPISNVNKTKCMKFFYFFKIVRIIQTVNVSVHSLQ